MVCDIRTQSDIQPSGALAVVHHPPYIHLQQERRVRTAPPVSVRVRVRVSVSFSVTVLCLQLWRCI